MFCNLLFSYWNIYACINSAVWCRALWCWRHTTDILKLKSRFLHLCSPSKMKHSYVKLFSLLPNSYINDKASQLPAYDILAPSLMGKWLCFKYFLHAHLSAFSYYLWPQLGYNWCPRVTCTFKSEWVVVILILSFINIENLCFHLHIPV